eukprot:929469-Amphidinium_carterae.1
MARKTCNPIVAFRSINTLTIGAHIVDVPSALMSSQWIMLMTWYGLLLRHMLSSKHSWISGSGLAGWLRLVDDVLVVRLAVERVVDDVDVADVVGAVMDMENDFCVKVKTQDPDPDGSHIVIEDDNVAKAQATRRVSMNHCTTPFGSVRVRVTYEQAATFRPSRKSLCPLYSWDNNHYNCNSKK